MKIRCQALDLDGKRCKNIARYKEHYHGDNEIYGYNYTHPDKDITWCEIFVCKKHLKTHLESENFAGKIDIDKDVFVTSQFSPNRNFTETKKSLKSYATDKCSCGNTKTKEATTCYDCYLKSFKRKTS